jgi:acyl phosphate:glycerol-3-phosphate acyltransferase
MTKDLLFLTAAYLLGSIPFGYLLVKWVKGVDVRTVGSGNIGMTNVWRVAGPGWGIATLVLDIAKGVAAVWLADHFNPLNDRLEVLCGLAALLGNIFSIFLKFKGGKGIGISVGIFFYLLLPESSAGLAVFILAVLATRMISVGSLLGVTTMMALTFYNLRELNSYSGLALVAAAMIWWTHRQNIKRILAGTESKIGKKKTSPVEKK